MNGGRDRSDGEPSSTRFADLVDEETVPIDRGPSRATPSSRPAKIAGQSVRRSRGAKTTSGPYRRPDDHEPLLGAADGVSDAQLAALSRGDPAPEEKIDLHGARGSEAPRLLSQRIQSARARGLRAVIVIHGQGKRSPGGEAVLRDGLPGWLAGSPVSEHVLAFAPAPDRLGGRGATMVLLRR